MTGGSSRGMLVTGGGAGVGGARSIASGEFHVESASATITRRFGGEPTDAASPALTSIPSITRRVTDATTETALPQDDDSKSHIEDDLEGYEEEAISLPQSTHSWLFTENLMSLPFWFAVGIVTLSYFCLILALLNIFEDGEPDNPLAVPFQVQNSVRISQYLVSWDEIIQDYYLVTLG